jgi:amino-acid N-acetyltransferase
MDMRKAKIADVSTICSLINQYAEQDKMLFRSMAEVYENLQSFIVAERDGCIVGCCALQIIWSNLAEIKSLAVDQTYTASGIGKGLITETVKQARLLGISELFALTLTPDFFEKMGFKLVEKQLLPMKVWSDCARCPKQQNCDETAVIKTVSHDV